MAAERGAIPFSPSPPSTLGVELEFQLLDAGSYNLVPMAREVLAQVPEASQGRVAPEFLQSILEIRSGICSGVGEVAADLLATIELVEGLPALEHGLLFGASLHPFACPEDQVLGFGERYWRIMKELQYVGRQFICQGLHIHLGMRDGETAIRVCDTIQPYLPVLLALSCSSPFFRGDDTGFHSYRTKLFEALPLAGITGFHGSWSGFEQELAMLREYQVISEPRDLWWDVRPSPTFGTVEIRICDLPLRFSQMLGLVALAQALAAGLAEQLVVHRPVSHQILSCNKWQAARHGLAGRFVDPLGLVGSGAMSMVRAARQMIAVLEPQLRRLGSRLYIDALEPLFTDGTGAGRQRQLVASGLNFHEMIAQLHGEFWL
ncbi:carboxylate-amine ligase [Desulfogranum mediterraneum]|uniref:carboxylate-amine ligase n=1 Tax=Desulfogranum mediterraneum TaxID=160661 RepID=UPI00040D3ACE|nr:YbdK family carboxylate-amine ligase [Desulfogranum mediterraneum]